MILGTENMAKIFRYGEMIELDPAGLIQEGEKQIRRLKSELASLERKPEEFHVLPPTYPELKQLLRKELTDAGA